MTYRDETIVPPEVLGDLANVDEDGETPVDNATLAVVRRPGTSLGDADAYGLGTIEAGNGNGEALRGEGQIDDPDTDVVVTHGLPQTPEPGEIQVQPRNTNHDVVRHAVHTETASAFTVAVDPAPGSTQSFEFGWLWVPAELAVEPIWAPDDLPLIYWFDVADESGFSDDDPIDQLTDLSGNSRHVVQGTESRRPLYKDGVKNGLPVARFDGNDDFLRHAYVDSNDEYDQPVTMFAVAQRVGATERQYLHDSGYSGTGQDNFRNILALLVSSSYGIYGGGGTFRSGGTSDTDWHVFRAVLNGNSSRLFIDGDEITLSGSTGGGSVRGLTLGSSAAASGADFLEGDAGEWFMAAGEIVGEDGDNADAYLSDKWDIGGS